jgi:hypothetical protein
VGTEGRKVGTDFRNVGKFASHAWTTRDFSFVSTVLLLRQDPQEDLISTAVGPHPRDALHGACWLNPHLHALLECSINVAASCRVSLDHDDDGASADATLSCIHLKHVDDDDSSVSRHSSDAPSCTLLDHDIDNGGSGGRSSCRSSPELQAPSKTMITTAAAAGSLQKKHSSDRVRPGDDDNRHNLNLNNRNDFNNDLSNDSCDDLTIYTTTTSL